MTQPLPSIPVKMVSDHTDAVPRLGSTLRGRIILASIVSAMFIIATLAVTSYRGQQQLGSSLSSAQLASDQTMLNKIIEIQIDILQERLSHIVSPGVVDALGKGDIDRLRTQAVPPFNRISSLVNLVKLNFYSQTGKLMFSAHDTGKDVTTHTASYLVSETLARRSIVSGVARDGAELNIFVAWPVYSQGNFIGVVEAGGAISAIVEDLGRTLHATASIVDWSSDSADTVRVLASTNYSLQAQGSMAVSPEFGRAISKLNQGESVMVKLPFSAVEAESGMMPISASPGPTLGALIIERDVTPLHQSMTKVAMQNMALSLVGVSGALLFVSIGIRRSLGQVTKLIDVINGFAQGRAPIVLANDTPDEVNALSKAITRMMAMVSRTHDQLAESERRARDASSAKSMFIANMSHELRTPLNAIMGYAELIRDDLLNRNDKTTAGDAEKVYQSALSLLAIINDLLDVAKLESSQVQLESCPVRIKALVSEATLEVEDLMQRNENVLEQIVEVGDAMVLVDPARMKQVLVNVLKNAARFTRKGQVTLRVQRLEQPRRCVMFEVQDTGIGIAQEKLKDLFHLFSQADQSTTRQHGGLGVGLAISKRLCDLMHGSIEIASTAGVGTTVRIAMPEHLVQRDAA